MYKKIVFILFIFLFLNEIKAQTYNVANGARANAMAGAAVLNDDVWAIQNNIAGIAKMEEMQVAAYFKNSFGISGLNYASLVASKPLKNGCLGVSFDRTGNKNLNEQRIGVGYAHNIDNVSLGAKINLLQVAIQDLGAKTVFAFEFGGLVQLNEELSFGAHIYNFSKVKAADYVDERFSTVLKAGISYRPYEKLIINVETEKNVEYKADFKAGLEYYIINSLAFRTGFSSLTNSGFFGLGIKTKSLLLDYALSSHSNLGFSNHISLTYFLKKSE